MVFTDPQIAGAGLDVMENEPIDAEHPLLGYDNVIITPHTSAYTYECLNGMGIKVVTDVKRVLSGRMPDEVINKKIFDTKEPHIKSKIKLSIIDFFHKLKN